MVENLKTSLAGSEASRQAYENQIEEMKKKLNDSSTTRGGGGGTMTLSEQQALSDELERLRGEYRKQVEWNSKLSVRSEVNGEETSREIESMRRKWIESKERVSKLEAELVRVNLEWQERYRHLEEIKVNESDLFNRQTLEAKNQVKNNPKYITYKLK